MNGIKIRGTGRCVPEHIVTNDDMAKIVVTNDEWITTRTGITAPRRVIHSFVSTQQKAPWKRPVSPPMKSVPALSLP